MKIQQENIKVYAFDVDSWSKQKVKKQAVLLTGSMMDVGLYHIHSLIYIYIHTYVHAYFTVNAFFWPARSSFTVWSVLLTQLNQ